MPLAQHLRRRIALAWQRLIAPGARTGAPVPGGSVDAQLAQAQAQLGRALQHAHESLRVMHQASQGLDMLAKQLPLRRQRRGDRPLGADPAGLQGTRSRAGTNPGEVGTLAHATLPNVDPAAQVRLLAGSLRDQGVRLEQALAALQADASRAAPLQAADTLASTLTDSRDDTFAEEPDRSISRRLAAAALRSAAQAPAHLSPPAPPAPPAGQPPGSHRR